MLEWLQSIDSNFLETLPGEIPPPVSYGLGAMAVLLALLILVRVGRARGEATQMEFAELKGRLSAMAEFTAQQNAEQVRALNDRLDGLSRHLAQALDTTTTRLGDNLSEAGRRTSESLSTLHERLALIDEAKRSLSALSSEVGSLHGVLANKQARGAFGQVRMETIVRDALPSGAFDFQPTLSNGKRPDCVIRLPNAEPLVVDSKFPWKASKRCASRVRRRRRSSPAPRCERRSAGTWRRSRTSISFPARRRTLRSCSCRPNRSAPICSKSSPIWCRPRTAPG